MKINEIVLANFSNIFEQSLLQEICNNGMLKHAEQDKIILEIRREIKFIPIIVSGIAKVMRRDGKGNGIFLHYISNCQSSAIAINYALEEKSSEIRIKADGDISYIVIPVKAVNLWFEKYESWRAFYSKLQVKQTSILLGKISDIAFTNLESRLIKYLEDTSVAYNNNVIFKKHFDIARDLKVSREAISRLLKKLEKEDIISLGRNKITLN
jgi:CRP/FNR family transcriptional regulator